MKSLILLLLLFLNSFSAITHYNQANISLCSPGKSKLLLSVETNVYNYSITYPGGVTTCNTWNGNSNSYVRTYTSGTPNTTTLYTYREGSEGCPVGQTMDASTYVCRAACPWATNPPWSPLGESGYSSASCSPLNANSLFANNTPNYVTDAAWCSDNSICYIRSGGCPTGQMYNKTLLKCVYPIGDSSKCPDGYITRNYSLGVDDLKTCWTEKICKNNPSIKETHQVSCGTSTDQAAPVTGPTGPTIPYTAPDSTSKPVGGNGGTSANCFASQSAAKMSCTPPNVLAFSCNPTTGEVTKSTCTPPTAPTTTPINSGDDTKSSTTEDIKNLSNTLPTAIKDALSSFFTDGSYSHLESIRGSLEANTILQADTNDKLDSISVSSDASLVLQGDTNTKLDDLKTSTDGIKDALTGGDSFIGAGMPTEGELTPDAETASGYDVFTNSYTAVKDSFNQAQIVFSHGLPTPTFGSGSCPTYQFYGNNVSLSKIGQALSPYSSVFAILIYISSIIASFRMVINFLSRGV